MTKTITPEAAQKADRLELLYVVDAAEPVTVSWLRDGVTFGALAGCAIVLNTWMPPSGWLNAALAVCWFLWVLGRSRRHLTQMTAEQAREWLDEKYPRRGLEVRPVGEVG